LKKVVAASVSEWTNHHSLTLAATSKFRLRLYLKCSNDLRWQGNFYEHRLRADDSVESVLRYLHLNPYRENLVLITETWPWFWLGKEEADWFVPLLDDSKPFPEWMQ